MGQARVVKTTRVSLPPAGGVPLEPVRLSFLDTMWVSLPPLQRVFLYRTDRPLPSVVEQLKDSLSRTLRRYYSLAGRFTNVSGSDDIVISFSGGGDDGVDFLEAEAEGVEFQRLADDEDHDVEAFLSLVPPLDVGELPAPVFSVQVTGFAGGGVAVGFAMHHMAGDGKAVWQFVAAWAAECRGGAAEGGRSGAEPVLDRSVIGHPRDEEIARQYVRKLAPNLPTLSSQTDQIGVRRQLSRRTFVVSAANIASLRDRGTAGAARPSAFVALSAYLWLTILKAKGIHAEDQMAFVGFLADCRRHLNPPISDGYFGNCVRLCIVQAMTSELLGGEGGFRAACVATKKAIDECLREPLSDCENWMKGSMEVPMERVVRVAASPRFRVYETDFGWGRPTRVELLSLNNDGEVALVAARDEEGAVQASVALSPLHMDAFAALLLGGLEGT